MSRNPFGRPVILSSSVNGPSDRLAQRLTQHRPTGFADGRQRRGRPLTRAALPQLSHEQTMHQQHEIHVPGLAFAAAQLTVAHAQEWLAVPMKGLRARPAMAVDAQGAGHFPEGTVGDQHFHRLLAIPAFPQNNQTHRMVYFGNPDCLGEIPIALLPHLHWPAVVRRKEGRHFGSVQFLALEPDLAIELQVADIPPLVVMNMVQGGGAGEIAAKRKIARNALRDDPIHPLAKQLSYDP